MRTPLSVLTFAVVAVAGCDTTFLFGPPRTPIDVGEGEGEGSVGGEGEGAAGEGEGEGPALLCGGTRTITASAPIPLAVPRARHSAARLADGRVLLAGGDDGLETSKTAELFDPATNAFTATGSMIQGRYEFALVALDDGRAIAFGGFNNDQDTPNDNGDLATTEIFADGAWTAGPAMPEPRSGLSAEKLDDGKVLVFGGSTNATSIPTDVLLFDPADDSLVVAVGTITEHGTSQTSHVLADGRVLMVGGYFTQSLTAVDVLFTDGHTAGAADIPGPRRSACAANDDNGNTLVFGGYNTGEIDDVEAFDPVGNAWTGMGAMAEPRAGCVAAELSCAALVCGSFTTTTCEAWDFASKAAIPVLDGVGANISSTLTALDDSHALLAGGTVNSFDLVPTAVVVTLAGP